MDKPFVELASIKAAVESEQNVMSDIRDSSDPPTPELINYGDKPERNVSTSSPVS